MRGHVFGRSTGGRLPAAAKGDGCDIVDSTGKRCLGGSGGTIDGQRGDHILLAPPFIIGDAQIDELAGKLAGAIRGALGA